MGLRIRRARAAHAKKMKAHRARRAHAKRAAHARRMKALRIRRARAAHARKMKAHRARRAHAKRVAHARRMKAHRARRASHSRRQTKWRLHAAKLRKQSAYKQNMQNRHRAMLRLAAKRRAVAKAAGILSHGKKACDKKPKLMVESINLVIMRHGTTVSS